MPVVRSPSITSSHLNAVAPLVRIKRINSDAESLYRVQATTISSSSRVTSLVPSPQSTYALRNGAALRVFSDRKSQPESKSQGGVNSTRRTTTPPSGFGSAKKTSEVLYAQPKRIEVPPRSKGERLEEQRQRRELRKRETLTTTPNIRTNRPSIFDSLTSRRR